MTKKMELHDWLRLVNIQPLWLGRGPRNTGLPNRASADKKESDASVAGGVGWGVGGSWATSSVCTPGPLSSKNHVHKRFTYTSAP